MNKSISAESGAAGARPTEVPGLPGAPKEIPGIIRYNPPNWDMAGGGSKRLPRRFPKEGEAITVNTNAGSIRVRVAKIRADRAIVGNVETLNASSGAELEINGIRHKDSVVVPGMDFVRVVHID